MNNTLKIVLGLVVGIFALSMLWKGLTLVLYLGVALAVGYFAINAVAPNLLGNKKKEDKKDDPYNYKK